MGKQQTGCLHPLWGHWLRAAQPPMPASLCPVPRSSGSNVVPLSSWRHPDLFLPPSILRRGLQAERESGCIPAGPDLGTEQTVWPKAPKSSGLKGRNGKTRTPAPRAAKTRVTMVAVLSAGSWALKHGEGPPSTNLGNMGSWVTLHSSLRQPVSSRLMSYL